MKPFKNLILQVILNSFEDFCPDNSLETAPSNKFFRWLTANFFLSVFFEIILF